MSYTGIGNTSDAEQDKTVGDFRLNRSNNNLASKPLTTKFGDILWNNKQKSDDSDSEISDSANFLAKGSLNAQLHIIYSHWRRSGRTIFRRKYDFQKTLVGRSSLDFEFSRKTWNTLVKVACTLWMLIANTSRSHAIVLKTKFVIDASQFSKLRCISTDTVTRTVDGTCCINLWKDEFQRVLQFDENCHWHPLQILAPGGLSGRLQEGFPQSDRCSVLSQSGCAMSAAENVHFIRFGCTGRCARRRCPPLAVPFQLRRRSGSSSRSLCQRAERAGPAQRW